MQQEKIYETLKRWWGYDSFRAGQREVIESVCAGRDTLALMPTGAGKSLLYQLPAMMKEGVCIVVTPLIALMKDQTDALRKRGISAVAVYSGMTDRKIDIALDNCVYGDVKFLYIAPERISSDMFTMRVRKMNVSLIAVDEAHCISQWGYDFRPSYLRLARLRELAPDAPVVALTASATSRVAEDIMKRLNFSSKNIVRTSFARKNLSFVVRRTDDKRGQLMRVLESVPGSGIVYVRTRDGAEKLSAELREEGVAAEFYHGGLPHGERSIRQDAWQDGRVRVMVATNAFGMGIDKSNVSYVIHYNMPKDIESYYQEAGRAGRDGETAECILLYSPADVQTNQFLIEHSDPNPDLTFEQQQVLKARDYDRLKQMTFYSTSNTCLRNFILDYFGEKSSNYCGNCSNCLTQFEETKLPSVLTIPIVPAFNNPLFSSSKTLNSVRTSHI